MVNRTFDLTIYYENWNRSSHSCFRHGFSLPLILSRAQILAEILMKEERNASSLGGRSMIALLMPSPTAFVYDYDYSYCRSYMNYLNKSLPGLTFLYYAGGAVIRFEDFVTNSRDDLFLLSYDLEVKAAAEPLVRRIRKVPRRLSNPRCSAYWSPLSRGSNQIIQYERLGHINFYRLSSHYFYSESSMRYMRITPLSSITFTVCTSRSNPWPYRNPLSSHIKGEDCTQITGRNFSLDLGNLCGNYGNLMDCPDLYISVQAQNFAALHEVKCEEETCAGPDESQFLIMFNNLDCTNKAAGNSLPQVTYLILISIVLRIFYFKE